MTKEELKTKTTDELIDELNYCGYDPYYKEYRADIVAEIMKRLQEPSIRQKVRVSNDIHR